MPYRYRYLTLTTAVENPAPDRRSKDWEKKPQFPAGMNFRVKTWEPDDPNDPNDRQVASIDRIGSYGYIPSRSPAHEALLAVAQERAPSLAERLDERGIDAAAVCEFIGVSDTLLDAAKVWDDARWEAKSSSSSSEA